MTHDSDEPSRLLKDLESIRTLLDEHPEVHSEEELDLSELDIPLLQDVFIEPGPESAEPAEPPQAPTEPESPPYQLTPIAAEQSANPFLPYDSLARLAQERIHLDKLMAEYLPQPEATEEPPTGAKEFRLEERLRSEVQMVLQDVIDDMIPAIEAELRNRLRGKVEEIVREQLK
ncbi:hypothetical protein [Pseudomonas saliphila]|uniref:hypothetical protein n=1 Tax=Pseudomonas saliphila TaxID=2586906 RepID=UPI00123A489C|nr:hypothetical protein [Pseudomonas saliphila]